MKRPVVQARRGIALVITLIMLSVVTITAVTFLAVSRRERGAVAAAGEQIDARYATDAALNRVKAEIASRINASTNRSAFGLMVSTNYWNPKANLGVDSFARSGDRAALTNVNYDLLAGAAADAYRGMLANLFYDARPPVFVPTNSSPQAALDFRFYLDLNRNGRFEPNGWQLPRDRNDQPVGKVAEFMVGDPEWIGLLENPGLPHSGNNRFGSRFAYVVVPAGREMDMNYIHNSAKKPGDANAIAGSFMRNQGVGAWELNLGALLSDLNTNAWPTNDYKYDISRKTPNSGTSLTDAGNLLRARRRVAATAGDFAPTSADGFFKAETGASTGPTNLLKSPVDWYSDGMVTDTAIRTLNEIRNPPSGNDLPGNIWSGGDYTNTFTDITQFFDPALGLLGKKLAGLHLSQNANLTYDRYTFYRLLGQLGTDVPDGRFESGFDRSQTSSRNPAGVFYRRAKLDLNFRQDDPNGDKAASASVAGFADWRPVEWFTNAASRLLLTEFPNGLPRKLSATESTWGIPVHTVATNEVGQRYLTNVYGSQMHRLLQVSANIYDYATNRMVRSSYPHLPSVFLPVLYRDNHTGGGTNSDPRIARIARFDEVTGTNVLSYPLVDLDDSRFVGGLSGKKVSNDGQPDLRDSAKEDLNGPNSLRQALYVGVPLVIGAKKGFPSFNEGFWQSALQVTRRLFVIKQGGGATPALAANELPFAGSNGKGVVTESQYRFDLANQFACEAWNSYTNAFPRPVHLYANNVLSWGLYRGMSNNGTRLLGTNYMPRSTNLTMAAGQWKGQQFTNALNGLLNLSFVYDQNTTQLFPVAETNAGRARVDQRSADGTYYPALSLYVTNWLQYVLVDDNSRAIVDYVTLKSVMAETNVLRFFQEDATDPRVGNLVGIRPPGNANIAMPFFWRTNRVVATPGAGTEGIYNQMLVSLGQRKASDQLWASAVGEPGRNKDKNLLIAGLNYFLYRSIPADVASQLTETDRKNVRNQFGAASVTNVQVGFNPSPTLYLTDRLQANDPLVHYTREDLAPGFAVFCDSGNFSLVQTPQGPVNSQNSGGGFQLTTNFVKNLSGLSLDEKRRVNGFPIAYAPWGRNPALGLKPVGLGAGEANDSQFNLYYKDPQIGSSDAWVFPTNASTKFPNIGFLGRVHRGTPWQTIYLKSTPVSTANDGTIGFVPRGRVGDRVLNRPSWAAWSGSPESFPTNDWKFLDLFTTAINDNAARGLMSVNQTNIASWSALLAGVSVLDNTSGGTSGKVANDPQPLELRPNSTELMGILGGYTNRNKIHVPGLLQTLGTSVSNFPAPSRTDVPAPLVALRDPFTGAGSFANLGSLLAVPTFSDQAPFLFDHRNLDPRETPENYWSRVTRVTDEVVERLPQQVLSLLRADEPRVVVYSFGQSLKPALNSLVTKPGLFYGLCTNYQITGEYVTKTTLRFDGPPGNLRAVVEDHRVLYPGN